MYSKAPHISTHGPEDHTVLLVQSPALFSGLSYFHPFHLSQLHSYPNTPTNDRQWRMNSARWEDAAAEPLPEEAWPGPFPLSWSTTGPQTWQRPHPHGMASLHRTFSKCSFQADLQSKLEKTRCLPNPNSTINAHQVSGNDSFPLPGNRVTWCQLAF